MWSQAFAVVCGRCWGFRAEAKGGLRWWRFKEYWAGFGGDGVGCRVGNFQVEGLVEVGMKAEVFWVVSRCVCWVVKWGEEYGCWCRFGE